MSPRVGSIKRRMQRPVVDLPQPDSPTSPNVSPLKISKVTPSTARQTSSLPSMGKCLARSRTLTSAPLLEVESISVEAMPSDVRKAYGLPIVSLLAFKEATPPNSRRRSLGEQKILLPGKAKPFRTSG